MALPPQWQACLTSVWFSSFCSLQRTSKISPQVAVRRLAEVPYPFKETANIFLQTKEKLQLFVPLTSCHQSDFLLFELAVCLGPWKSIDKLFGDPELCFFSFLGNVFIAALSSSSWFLNDLQVASQFSESYDVCDLYFLLPLELHEVRKSDFFFFKDYPAAVFTTCYKNINGLNVFLWKYFYVALLGEGTLKTHFSWNSLY